MFKNYIKIAIRSLLKQKVYTGINILGLAISITSCLLIVIYVQYELSYDHFLSQGDRIYKMVLERKYPNHITHYSVTPHSLAKVMKQDFPEIETTLHLFGPNKNTLITYKVNESEIKSFEEDFFIQADSTLFEFFDVEIIKGDKEKVLTSPSRLLSLKLLQKNILEMMTQ